MLSSRALAAVLLTTLVLSACSADPGGGELSPPAPDASAGDPPNGTPPGRFPLGRNAKGIEIAGNLLHWVADGEYFFNWTLSWENHHGNLNNQNWRTAWPGEPNGYYAIGFRCVY